VLIRHYLQPLLAPQSVALVGASEREGALGNIVYRTMIAAAATPRHDPCCTMAWRSVRAASARANAPRVAVIPAADAPPAKQVRQASKQPRAKAARAKVRSKTKTGGKAKRRAKR